MFAKFPEEFPGELVVDLGRRLAGGTIGLRELKDAMWVGGCLIEMFDGDPADIPAAAYEAATVEELGQKIAEMGEGEDGTSQAINIGVWLPIIMQIIQLILSRIGNRNGGSDGGTVPGPV